MANEISELLDATRDHLVAKIAVLSAADVTIGFPDDRTTGTTTDVAETRVTLSLIGFEPDQSSRYSGQCRQVIRDLVAIAAYEDDPETAPIPTAELKRLPVPFRATVQIDTFDLAKFKSWQLQETIPILLEAGIEFTTASGNIYKPTLEPGDDADDLTADGFHKTYRFWVPIWFEDSSPATVTLIVETYYTVNREQILKSVEA